VADVEIAALELSDDPALEHHDESVGQRDRLVQILRDQQDAGARTGGVHQDGAHRLDRAHVQAPGGGRRDERVRLGADLTRQQHLLDVAARQDAGGGIDAGRLDAEPLDHVVGVGPDHLRPQERPRTHRRTPVALQCQIAVDRQRRRQAGLQPVLRNERQAQRGGLARPLAPAGHPVDDDAAGGAFADAVDGCRELALAVARDAADRQHLTGPELQADLLGRALRPDALGAEPDDVEDDSVAVDLGPLRRIIRVEHDRTTHHLSGQLSRRRLGGDDGAHRASVAERGDAVGDLHHLVQLVGDEDHRASVVGHPPHGGEEGVRLLRGQHGGRLVEDQDLGLPVERLEDLDALLLAHRQLPHVGERVDLQAVLPAESRDPLGGLLGVVGAARAE